MARFKIVGFSKPEFERFAEAERFAQRQQEGTTVRVWDMDEGLVFVFVAGVKGWAQGTMPIAWLPIP